MSFCVNSPAIVGPPATANLTSQEGEPTVSQPLCLEYPKSPFTSVSTHIQESKSAFSEACGLREPHT